VSIEKLKENYSVKIRWIHFPLHPETPQEGQTLENLFPGRDLTPIKKRMKNLMADAGLPFGDRSYTYNSRLAQELGKWADTQENGEIIHDFLYKAYFVDNINISDIDELEKIAAAAGLDRITARRVLEERSFQSEVDEDWRFSREIGVTGVPTFYSNNLAVVGCQPYETLEKFVKHLMELRKKSSA
jgi:predicted DsbA family dithiol-disulfide isomerase